MKVIGIVGSGRKGNTYVLTRHVLNRMASYARQAGIPFTEEVIELKDIDLPLCVSCHQCVTERGEGRCPHRGVVGWIGEKLQEADGIILASPIYSLQVSARMKNLIDHLSFYYHRPRLFGKYALALTDTAGGGHKAAAKYLKSVLHAWGVERPHTLPVMLWNVEVVMNKKLEKKIEAAAGKLYRDILQKKVYKPSLGDIGYFNVWRALNADPKPGTADYDYWNEQGWLRQSYYRMERMNPVTRTIGKFMFAAIRRIFAQKK